MANTVLVPTQIMAENVDAKNRVAIINQDVDNGTALVLGVTVPAETKRGQREVFQATIPTAVTKGVWMAYSPEIPVISANGQQYRIGSDPRSFTNVANVPFDVFKPEVDDLIQVTVPFFKASEDPGTVTGATVVEIGADGTFSAKVSATASFAGTAFKIIQKEPIMIGNEAVDAWILECTQN